MSQPCLRRDPVEQRRYSASTASSVLPGAQRRVPTMRHVGREAVVEVAAVHLADEVRLGADQRDARSRQLLAFRARDRLDDFAAAAIGWGVPVGVFSSCVGMPVRGRP